jgi:hypothetical protein
MNNKSLLDILTVQTDFAQGGILKFLVTLIIALVFSLAVTTIYRAYYRDNEPIDASISRSFPLMGPAVTTIFWMIQFSLPLSLGLLGALSFVRFRTPIKRAEDIAFILILIAGSLACAVGQFMNMLVLILLIFFYGLFRDKIPGLSATSKKFAILTVHSSKDINIKKLTNDLQELSSKVFLVSSSKTDSLTTTVFNFSKLDKDDMDDINKKIDSYDKSAKVNFFFPENQYGVN